MWTQQNNDNKDENDYYSVPVIISSHELISLVREFFYDDVQVTHLRDNCFIIIFTGYDYLSIDVGRIRFLK